MLLWANRPLRVLDLLRITGWSRATLYRRIDQDGFPAPIGRVGSKSLWEARQVRHWINDSNLRLRLSSEEYARHIARQKAIDAYEASLPSEEARMAFRRWLWSGNYG
jgi:predicted DNA-binding transcriptional regulator AlpA